ncbi:hypothetical protein [Lentzea tibetensis]|uniref:hypothetical protein n=1 Tax=Lentzea tibetensis TaxID=2591470 RepID=UPI00164874C1|nr:hypothetical protein [Lentzea tibetensis]
MIEIDISKLDLLPADANTPTFSGTITCPMSSFLGPAVVTDSTAKSCDVPRVSHL